MKIPRSSGVISNRQTSTGQVSSDATRNAVNNFSGVIGIVDSYFAQKSETEAQQKLNERERKLNEWKSKNLTRTGEAANGLTEEYDSFVKGLDSELGSSVSARAKGRYTSWASRANESDRMGVMMHQQKQDMVVKESAFKDGITLSDETLRVDAKNWQRAKEIRERSFESALGSGLIPEEKFKQMKTEDDNRFRTELGKSYYTQDKHDFMKNISQFGFGKPEVEAYKAKYKNDLAAEERERKSLFSEEAKLLYGSKDDMLAQATANGDTSHLIAGADKLEKMGYKDWASNLREDANLYNKVISFNDEHKNKPLREIIQAAQSMKVPEKLNGSGVELKSIQAIQKETLKSAKIFDADPAQFVSGWAQGQTMEDIVSSRLSLQQDQGLYPSKGFQALTQSERKNFKGAWETGDIKQKTDLVLQSFRYGKHTPRVLEEVGVNSALSIAPLLKDEKDVELFVAGVATKAEILDEAQRSEYSAAAKGSNFYSTLLKVQAAFPTNPDLPQKIKDIESAMTGIGSRMVDPGAGAKFFDERIDTIEADDKLVYFPNTVDADEVEGALDKRKEDITSKFKTGNGQHDLSTKWALRDATWVNTSTGFVLMDARSGSYIPGSEMDMIELDSLRKELAKAKVKETHDLQTTTFMRR